MQTVPQADEVKVLTVRVPEMLLKRVGLQAKAHDTSNQAIVIAALELYIPTLEAKSGINLPTPVTDEA